MMRDTHELQVDRDRKPIRDARGRFLPGHVSPKKGKTWDELMPKKSQARCKKGWKNLDKYRRGPHPGRGGKKRKPVVGVTDSGRLHFFPYAKIVIQNMGGVVDNVRRCARQNRKGPNTDHKYMGLRFYYEDDRQWIKKVSNE